MFWGLAERLIMLGFPKKCFYMGRGQLFIVRSHGSHCTDGPNTAVQLIQPPSAHCVGYLSWVCIVNCGHWLATMVSGDSFRSSDSFSSSPRMSSNQSLIATIVSTRTLQVVVLRLTMLGMHALTYSIAELNVQKDTVLYVPK